MKGVESRAGWKLCIKITQVQHAQGQRSKHQAVQMQEAKRRGQLEILKRKELGVLSE